MKGKVLSMDVVVEPTGYRVRSVHRTAQGGTETAIVFQSKFAGVLAYLNNLVDVYGVER